MPDTCGPVSIVDSVGFSKPLVVIGIYERGNMEHSKVGVNTSDSTIPFHFHVDIYLFIDYCNSQ